VWQRRPVQLVVTEKKREAEKEISHPLNISFKGTPPPKT
jgi:hypothetical protein